MLQPLSIYYKFDHLWSMTCNDYQMTCDPTPAGVTCATVVIKFQDYISKYVETMTKNVILSIFKMTLDDLWPHTLGYIWRAFFPKDLKSIQTCYSFTFCHYFHKYDLYKTEIISVKFQEKETWKKENLIKLEHPPPITYMFTLANRKSHSTFQARG